jgi:nucleotide-binding universal stress UspA family protein
MTENLTPDTSTTADLPIVVGIDGSAGSTAALAFAFEEAELRGADLRVIYAWYVPNRWAEAYNPEWPADERWFQTHAREEAEGHVDTFLAGKPRPSWLRVDVVEDNPATALLDAADHARLLVVGSRGHGGFKRLLLGSVSTACVHHAACPVVVVPNASDG